MRRRWILVALLLAALFAPALRPAPRTWHNPLPGAWLWQAPLEATYFTNPFKTIQYGTVAPFHAASSTATLGTAVTTARTVVLSLGSSNDDSTSTQAQGQALCGLVLTNTTTVTANLASLHAADVTGCSFVALEFLPQFVKSLQQGSFTIGIGTSSNTQAITAVTVAKAWVVATAVTNVVNASMGDTVTRVTLTNSTTLTATSGVSATGVHTIYFQVIEFF